MNCILSLFVMLAGFSAGVAHASDHTFAYTQFARVMLHVPQPWGIDHATLHDNLNAYKILTWNYLKKLHEHNLNNVQDPRFLADLQVISSDARIRFRSQVTDTLGTYLLKNKMVMEFFESDFSEMDRLVKKKSFREAEAIMLGHYRSIIQIQKDTDLPGKSKI